MACIRPDGSLTQTGRAVLSALAAGMDGERTADETGLPLYRVRMVIRALGAVGLIVGKGTGECGAEGRYELTAAGREKLGGSG